MARRFQAETLVVFVRQSMRQIYTTVKRTPHRLATNGVISALPGSSFWVNGNRGMMTQGCVEIRELATPVVVAMIVMVGSIVVILVAMIMMAVGIPLSEVTVRVSEEILG